MGRISQSFKPVGKPAQREDEVLLSNKIRALREERRNFLMTLADGNTNEYQLLKSLSLVDFIAKFSKFTSSITTKQKIAQEHKKRAKRGR